MSNLTAEELDQAHDAAAALVEIVKNHPQFRDGFVPVVYLSEDGDWRAALAVRGLVGSAQTPGRALVLLGQAVEAFGGSRQAPAVEGLPGKPSSGGQG